jgi:TonB family protein
MRIVVPAWLGRAIPLLAAAALLHPALTSAQSRTEQLLSDRPAPRHGCSIAPTPGRLPALSQLVGDSATFATAVAEYARQHPLRDGGMFALYSVAFTAEGTVERVKELDYLLPQGGADEFTSLVRASLRPQAAGKSWSVRMRIEPGAATVFRVGRSEVCEAESLTRFTVEAPSLEGGRRPTPLRLRVLVDARGNVTDVQLLRGSGSDELDRWVLDALRQNSFSFGLVDGVAVPMAVDVTVPFRSRG